MSDFSARKHSSILANPSSRSKKDSKKGIKKGIQKMHQDPAHKLDKMMDKIAQKNADTIAEGKTNEGSAKKSTFAIRSGSSLKMLRVTSSDKDAMERTELKAERVKINSEKEKGSSPDLSAKRVTPCAHADIPSLSARSKPDVMKQPARKEMFEGDAENEPVLMLSPKNSVPMRRSSKFKVTSFLGMVLTIFWGGLCAYYVQTNMGWASLLAQQPHILGGFLAGILAPIALLWMVLAYIQRGSDIHMYADALRAELQAMIFPSEERSEVIHKDIEALCEQAAELSTSSKAILDSIHRARVGLRNEIRDFSALSKKTEFHIDRMANGLSDRSTKLLELTNEIEARTTSLDAKSLSGAKAWDEAAHSILGKAGEIETALKQGAKQILSAAEEADETTSSISDKLEKSFVVLTNSVNSVKAMTGNTVSAITEASKIIEDNRDTLGSGAEILANKAAEITDTLSSSVSVLQDSVDQMLIKTDNMEERLGARVNSLDDIMGGMDGKIEAIESMGVETANKLSESMVSAVSGANNIESSVRRAVESLGKATMEATAQADGVLADVSEKVSGLNEVGNHTANNMKNVLGLMEKSREQIEQAATMADSQVEKLSVAVESQSKQIKQAQESLDDRANAIQLTMEAPLEAMIRAVDNASEKHEQIEETLSNRIVELNSASDKALENAGFIRDDLRMQAQDISTLVGQIAGHSRSIGSLMNSQKEDLSVQVRTALEEIDSVGKSLESQSDKLSYVAQKAEENITQLKGHITEQCEDVSEGTTNIVRGLATLDEALEEKVSSLVSRSDEAARFVEEAAETIEGAAMRIEPVYNRALIQVDEAQNRFEKMSSSFEAGSVSNLDKLKSMGIMFDERLQSLTTSASEASRILNSSSENLSGRVQDIESATKVASEKIRDIENSFKNQAEDIHLTTDEAMLRIENTQKALNNQFHDLSTSVGQSVVQVEEASVMFGKQADDIRRGAVAATNEFDVAGEKAEKQMGRLNEMAKTTSEQMGRMAHNVLKDSKGLLNSSSQVLIDLKKAGDGIALRAREAEEQMKYSLQTTQRYGEALDKQADKVAETSHKTADNISEAISILARKMLDVDKTAKGVQVNVDSSCEKLSDETDRMAEISLKASRVVEEAASSYVRQSNSLFKATEDAAASAEKIRQTDWHVQRETFLGSTKFVLESLHSLSVDITRSIDGGVQERTWKLYKKGDIAAFTSMLVDRKESLPMGKTKEKYKNDNEFRTYINRFARQFEEIYEQSLANNYGELLAATFASSDIGKLYGTLCEIAGRQNIIKRLQARAA